MTLDSVIFSVFVVVVIVFVPTVEIVKGAEKVMAVVLISIVFVVLTVLVVISDAIVVVERVLATVFNSGVVSAFEFVATTEELSAVVLVSDVLAIAV